MRGMEEQQDSSLAPLIERRKQILELLEQKQSMDEDASALLAELTELTAKILSHRLPSKELMETIALAEHLKTRRAEKL
jgi:hypothetical protein